MISADIKDRQAMDASMQAASDAAEKRGYVVAGIALVLASKNQTINAASVADAHAEEICDTLRCAIERAEDAPLPTETVH